MLNIKHGFFIIGIYKMIKIWYNIMVSKIALSQIS
jgi:hypothetical protein